MKKTNLLFILLAASLACAPAPTPAERMLEDLTYLASDEMEGRGVGTEGLARAADYLVERFEDIGLETPDGTYRQDFTIDPSAPAAAHSGLGGEAVTNVIGLIPGQGALADETVVVGAHYDHLGFGGSGSLQPDLTGTVHNGADDNASGTVALLDIAHRILDRSNGNARTVVFVAFTAEELGLIGSAHYVANPVRPNESTFAMVNLDMVGRLEGARLAALGAESAEELPALLEDVAGNHALEIAAAGDGFGRSDHQSFFIEEIPVLHFFTGTHVDYHATTDDVENINLEGLVDVSAYVTDVVWALATRTEPLTFVPAEPPQEITSSGERPYLGTIPDMTSSPGGVRLSGVTPGSPADEAGMEAGDILIGLGSHGIADLFEMTNALNAHAPGDEVVLRVRRGADTLELNTTLRRRGG